MQMQFAYQKIKPSERIFTSSTKLMAAILTKFNIGLIKGSSWHRSRNKQLTNYSIDLMELKETFLVAR